MKRLAFAAVLLAQSLVAGASPDMTYDHLPDATHKLVRLGSRWVIQDARGFFVGYYVAPRPKPAAFTPTYSRPQTQNLSGSNSFGSAPGFGYGNNGYSNFNNGFNGFNNGFGFNGYGYNGFGFNGYGYNNSCRGNFNNFNHFNNCRQQPPRPVEQPRTRAMVR